METKDNSRAWGERHHLSHIETWEKGVDSIWYTHAVMQEAR